MRLLFIDWESIGNDFIIKEFMSQGIEVVKYPLKFSANDTRRDEALATDIAKSILSNETELVFSFNYLPVVAIAANACKAIYVSWTYDSPYIQLYSKTISLPTNIAFVFDREEVTRLNNLGVENVFHLPMCAPVDAYDKMIPTSEHHRLYDTKISMIGSMYSESKQDLLGRYLKSDDYTMGYIEGLLRSQQQLYGVSILETCLSPEMTEKIQKECGVHAQGDGLESVNWTIANYLFARKLTSYERKEYMELVDQNFDNSAIYTHESTPFLNRIKNRGKLDYYNQMPYAIKCSDINLNISLRSIVNAIPLRIFDIMGCGSFCLTNYQGEMFDYFTPGEDFDYFDSKESFIDKCDYYLKNEKERREIALNGYKKIKEYHTYKQRVEDILNVLS